MKCIHNMSEKKSDTEADGASFSQVENVRTLMKEDIILGLLAPGDFLSEARISEKYGVSRTPVREAIRALAGDGLVTLRPRQRAVVRGLKAAEIVDQFEAMAELEASCAWLAAYRRTATELAALEEAQAKCRQLAIDQDPVAYYGANVPFHELIYTASGNNYLRSETLRLRNRLSFMRITQGQLPGRLASSSSEHDAVLDAIINRDCEGAANAMRLHLNMQSESVHRMLRHTDNSGFVHIAAMNSSDQIT